MERSSTLLVHCANTIKFALEGNDVVAMINAMKNAIMLLLNGETLLTLSTTIHRCLSSADHYHTIQKLLLLYFKINDSTGRERDFSLRRLLIGVRTWLGLRTQECPEMILIWQTLQNNLRHPDEYIRGVTLRILGNLSKAEIIEPLIPSILWNIEHSHHPFIRHNAILAFMSICKLPHGKQLLPDAPEVIEMERSSTLLVHFDKGTPALANEIKFNETEEIKAKGMSQLELEDEVQDDLKCATGEFTMDNDDANKLNRIVQLTGFNDPVYAEAFVTVCHNGIVLDVTVINRTNDTLQNLCLVFETMGDLKLVECQQNYMLAPESSKQIRAYFFVSSTETVVIFGNIIYKTLNALEATVVVLNDIHINIMGNIFPVPCYNDVVIHSMLVELMCVNNISPATFDDFRHLWAEFKSESKVAVNTVLQNVKEFLNHIIKSTNMKCILPKPRYALNGECRFLDAYLYGRSVFNEGALVHIWIEKQADGKLGGKITIRSETQGIGISLYDKITLKQKCGG